MNSNRIKEIQEETGYRNSISVAEALFQVWNECEQEANKKIDALKKENFILAAGQCVYGDGCISGEYGDALCPITMTKDGIKRNKWYNDKNNFPCLCWVWDNNIDCKQVSLVISYNNDNHNLNFKAETCGWNYATPLTKEEVLKYCFEKELRKSIK